MMRNTAIAEWATRLGGRGDVWKRAADSLKAARARLITGTEIKPEFEYELLAMFVRNEIGAAFAMPALYALFAIACMFWAPIAAGVLWLATVIVAKIVLLNQGRRFLALPRYQVDIGLWRRRFVLIELLNAAALTSFVFMGVGQYVDVAEAAAFSSHVFIFAALIVFLAIRVMFAATITQVLLAGTIPMTLAVVVGLLQLGDPFYLALASMSVGIYVYFLFLARGLKSTALSMLEFRAEKDALIAELEEQKSVSDEARRRAETANRSKSRFLTTMSHELRTPLNAILGFSEVMNTEVMGPMANRAYKEYAGNIFESGRHLLQLINEILDLSRIESGRYDLHEEPLRLAELVCECHRLMKLRMENKGLEVVESIAPNLPLVWADPRAIRQVCLNLMSNTLKFTPRGGRITLTVGSTDSGGQFVSVRDTGPGIPEDEIPKVMQPFGQGALAHQSAEGGAGLGLPIVEHLAELHGGTFSLKSASRKGTLAIVELPPHRVLQTVTPAQPLVRDAHRPKESAAHLTQPPRPRASQKAPSAPQHSTTLS